MENSFFCLSRSFSAVSGGVTAVASLMPISLINLEATFPSVSCENVALFQVLVAAAGSAFLLLHSNLRFCICSAYLVTFIAFGL